MKLHEHEKLGIEVPKIVLPCAIEEIGNELERPLRLVGWHLVTRTVHRSVRITLEVGDEPRHLPVVGGPGVPATGAVISAVIDVPNPCHSLACYVANQL